MTLNVGKEVVAFQRMVIAAVVGLAGYLVYASGVGGKALNWLAGVFNSLKNDALAAFQGISDALAAGDIGLAAQILWATLKVQWKKGVNWLEEKWVGFKEYFLSVWTEAVYGLSKLLTDGWVSLQSIWTESVAAMSTAWTAFSSGAVSAWKTTQNYIARGIVHLMGMLDDSIDVDATLATLQDDFDRDRKRRESETQEKLGQIEGQRQERQGQIEQERSGAIDALEQDQREHVERKQRYDAQLQESRDELAKARAEWEKSLGEAAKRRQEKESKTPERLKAGSDLALDLDGMMDQTQAKTDIRGTFQAAAIRGLGSDSLAQRTARASEEIAGNTEQLVREAQHGGLVFG